MCAAFGCERRSFQTVDNVQVIDFNTKVRLVIQYNIIWASYLPFKITRNLSNLRAELKGFCTRK